MIAATCAALAGGALASSALAAQTVAYDARDVHIAVNSAGVALVTYKKGATVGHVLARGAINALAPSRTRPQVRFQVDPTGGKIFFGHRIWQTFKNACKPYDGPALYALVAACKAPDGSYWAVQSWQGGLPNLGYLAWLPDQLRYRLELSHWSGPLAQLTLYQGWLYSRRYNALFGKYTYNGQPVHGYGTTRYGIPTDSYGRLLSLDTFNSLYGPGWFRENAFVSHNPSGAFCYGFYNFDPTKGGYKYPPGETEKRGPAVGSKYRIIAQGPGVTPLVTWTGRAGPAFEPGSPASIIQDRQVADFVPKLGSKQCSKGVSRLRATRLDSLRDDFHGSLSRWKTVNATGGATVKTGPNGATFSLPAGGGSGVELRASKLLIAYDAPAYVDLGAGGVPPGAAFSMLLYPSHGTVNVRDFGGLRIGQGQIELVSRKGNVPRLFSPLRATVHTITAARPYTPSAMRWLWIWERRFSKSSQGAEVWYAPAAAGPWTRLGGIGGFDVTSKTWFGLIAQGDGSSAKQVTVASLNQPGPPSPTPNVAVPGFAYWSGPDGSVGRARSDGGSVNEGFVRPPGTSPNAVAVTRKYVFWMPLGATGACDIGRANLDGTGVNSHFVHAPDCRSTALAADEGHLYWGTRTAAGTAVARARVEGGNVEPAFIAQCSGPAPIDSIALDAGHVYWSGGCSPSIHRADLDGKTVEPEWIHTVASSIAVSRTNVYWVGGGDGFIHRASIGGTGVNDRWLAAASGDSVLAGGVATDGDHLYWVARTSSGGAIVRARVDGSAVNPAFVVLTSVPAGITATPSATAVTPPAEATRSGTVIVNGKPFTGGAIPFGSTIDVTHGSVTLTTQAGTATVSGQGVSAQFRLLSVTDQGVKLVDIKLVGGNFGVCKLKKSAFAGANPTAKPPKKKPKKKPKPSKKTVRRAYVKAKGHYRTDGNYSSATVRGTSWLMADRCDGTFEQTFQGAVTVRDRSLRKTVVVRAGKSYLARKP